MQSSKPLDVTLAERRAPARPPMTHDRLGRPLVGPCLLWTGRLPKDGYPRLTRKGYWLVPQLVHRIAYALATGHPLSDLASIPGLDHLCRTPACSAAAHLEPKSRAENLRIGNPNQNERKQVCDSGHPFSDENTYVRTAGTRDCRQCKRIAAREWYRRKHRPDLVGKPPLPGGRPIGPVGEPNSAKPRRNWQDGT
jgi:hypothetical protein